MSPLYKVFRGAEIVDNEWEYVVRDAELMPEGEQIIEYGEARVPVAVEGESLRVYISRIKDPHGVVSFPAAPFDDASLKDMGFTDEIRMTPASNREELLEINAHMDPWDPWRETLPKPHLIVESHSTQPEVFEKARARERE